MAVTWGIILTAVPGFLFVLGTILIFWYRNDPFIKCRNPTLLIIQNLGMMVTALITSLYIALRPNFSCYVYYFGSLFFYSGVAYPTAIRYWEYCVNFHVSKVRSKFRSDKMLPEWGKEDWFFRNRWCAKHNFLNKVYLVGFWVWLIPIVPYFFLRDQYEYSKSTGGCSIYDGGVYMVPILALIFLSAALFLAIMTRGARDAYYIKQELAVISCFWVIIIIVSLAYQLTASGTTQRKVSSGFFILLGEYNTFIWSVFFPLFLAHRNRRLKQMRGDVVDSEFKDFALQLENLVFRNALLDFLETQFCQENILFYQAVLEWKQMDPSDPQRVKTARSIHENYVLESGSCQVNISGPSREMVSSAVALDNIPREAFDEAISAVLTMVHSNSYYQFKASKLYKNAKV